MNKEKKSRWWIYKRFNNNKNGEVTHWVGWPHYRVCKSVRPHAIFASYTLSLAVHELRFSCFIFWYKLCKVGQSWIENDEWKLTQVYKPKGKVNLEPGPSLQKDQHRHKWTVIATNSIKIGHIKQIKKRTYRKKWKEEMNKENQQSKWRRLRNF